MSDPAVVPEPMSGRRLGLIAIGALAGITAVALAIDAVVVTDEERVEAIVDDLIGELTPERIERVCALLDPDKQPVELQVRGMTMYYDASQDPDARQELPRRVRQGLSRHVGVTIRALRESITVAEDEARISLQLVSREGMVDMQARLRRHGDEWLVASAQIR